MIRRALLYIFSIFDDLLLLGGAVAVVVGVSMIYAPAAWIVGGALAMGAAWLIAKATPNSEVPDDIA